MHFEPDLAHPLRDIGRLGKLGFYASPYPQTLMNPSRVKGSSASCRDVHEGSECQPDFESRWPTSTKDCAFNPPMHQPTSLSRSVVNKDPLLLTNLNGLHDVKSLVSKEHVKWLVLNDGHRIPVHRFAIVGVGDTIRIAGEQVWLHTADSDIPILPTFTISTKREVVPGRLLHIKACEITTQPEFASYEHLAEYHYRSKEGYGRRSVLLLTTSDADFPQTLGFIEITSAFMFLKNRKELLDAPFSEPGRKVAWETWSAETNQRFVSLTARISRVVVHPEVRGLGLSHDLVHAAERFCEQRWQIAGIRPLFLEITADMLRFNPFVWGSGMHWIGESPGNLNRVRKDMEYLDSVVSEGRDHWINRKTSRGIAIRQRKDISRLLEIRDRLGDRNLFEELEKVVRGESDEDEMYELLTPMIRFPKPTFIKGLTKSSEAYIRRRVSALPELRLKQGSVRPLAGVPEISISGNLEIRNLSLGFSIDSGSLGPIGPGTIRRAFGMNRKHKFSTGLQALSVTVRPSQICYVHGASGTGKTKLLELIKRFAEGSTDDLREETSVHLQGEIRVPRDTVIGELGAGFPKVAIAAALHAPIEDAVEALNYCGLAEPRLYLSRFDHLSAGQQYRAELARLLTSDANVWLIDEFASNLDDATAIAVGRNFAKAARLKGAVCVIASVRRFPVLNAVNPDIYIKLDHVSPPVLTLDWESPVRRA